MLGEERRLRWLLLIDMWGIFSGVQSIRRFRDACHINEFSLRWSRSDKTKLVELKVTVNI